MFFAGPNLACFVGQFDVKTIHRQVLGRQLGGGTGCFFAPHPRKGPPTVRSKRVEVSTPPHSLLHFLGLL